MPVSVGLAPEFERFRAVSFWGFSFLALGFLSDTGNPIRDVDPKPQTLNPKP